VTATGELLPVEESSLKIAEDYESAEKSSSLLAKDIAVITGTAVLQIISVVTTVYDNTYF